MSAPPPAGRGVVAREDRGVASFEVSELKEGETSGFARVRRIRYSQGQGHARVWDLVLTFEAVAVLVYHRTRRAFVLVRQFRPPVYFTSTEEERARPGAGYTMELPAGLADKGGKSLRQTAAEEVKEETGYTVRADDLEDITECRGNVGLCGNKVHLYYAEVDGGADGGGGVPEEGEEIEVLHLPEADALNFLFGGQHTLPASIGWSFLWWFQHKRGGKIA